jgi:S1-C subfamily serine protease
MHRSDSTRRLPAAATLCAALLLTACAAPVPVVAPGAGARIEAQLAQRCAASIGAEVATLDDFRPQDRERAAVRLGISRSLQVIAVTAGSPADAAGLRPGDLVEAVDGVTVPAGADARRAFLAAFDGRAASPVLRVRRGGHLDELTLPPRSACTTSVAVPKRDRRA